MNTVFRLGSNYAHPSDLPEAWNDYIVGKMDNISYASLSDAQKLVYGANIPSVSN